MITECVGRRTTIRLNAFGVIFGAGKRQREPRASVGAQATVFPPTFFQAVMNMAREIEIRLELPGRAN